MLSPIPENPIVPLQIASLWRRLAAMLYDSFLLFGLSWLYFAIVLLIKVRLLGSDYIEHSPTAGGGPFTFVGLMLVYFLFFSGFWRWHGQTLGMQAWRLKIVTTSAAPFSWQQCAIRFIGAMLSLACGGLGFFCILWRSDHRAWHDRWSDTCIVLLPKND